MDNVNAVVISSLPDAFLLRVVLQRKGFEVELTPSPEEIDSSKKVVIIDKELFDSLESNSIKDDQIVVLLSRDSIDLHEIKRKNVSGYIRLPFSLEFIISFVQELSYKFNDEDSRRSEIRFQIEIHASIVGEEENHVEAFIMDLSQGGFKARLNSIEDAELLAKKGKLSMILSEKDQEIFSNQFELRWVREENEAIYFGGEWINLSEDNNQKLLNFISVNTGLYSF